MKKLLSPLVVCLLIISVLYWLLVDLELYFEDLLNWSTESPPLFALISFAILACDVLLPVPSSIIMFINGLVLGLFYGTLCSLVASLFTAFIGYYLGRRTAIGIGKPADDRVIAILHKYGMFGIIITRGIPILSESVCFTAGYHQMNLKLYALLNFIGYLPLCLVYAFCGTLGQSKNLFLISFAISLIVSLLLWIFGRRILIQVAGNWYLEEL